MARKKEFNPEQALNAAMHTFWLQGYVATSMDDLCAAMGIKRGSLYDTFGDKRRLFVQCLNHYVDLNQPPQDAIQAADSALDAIHLVFRMFVEQTLADPQSRGCLMVNTVAELAAVDPEIAEIGERQNAMFRRVFHDLLVQAEANGEIRPNQDLEALAHFLINTFYGLRITSKLHNERAVLEGIVKTALSRVQ